MTVNREVKDVTLGLALQVNGKAKKVKKNGRYGGAEQKQLKERITDDKLNVK
jgi:hypothetical protein